MDLSLSLVANKALVIWKWKWTDQDETFEHNASNDEKITAIPETPPAVSDVEEEDEQEEDCDGFDLGFSPIVTHTVSFKCMGTTKEDRYQETLARIVLILLQLHSRVRLIVLGTPLAMW